MPKSIGTSPRNGGSDKRRAARREVGGDREDEAIASRPVLGALEQRRVGAAVGVEDERLQLARDAVVDAEERDAHAGGGAAVGGVEDVRRELSHRAFPAPRTSAGAAQKCIVAGTR